MNDIDRLERLGGFLAIGFEPYDDWNVELHVRAQANGFAGRSMAYQALDLLRDFAVRLREYPISESAPPTLSAGFDVEEHVGISVIPIGPLGQLSILVHLAEPWPGPRRPSSVVRLEVRTTYERLRRFGADLEYLAAGEQPTAIVEEELLA